MRFRLEIEEGSLLPDPWLGFVPYGVAWDEPQYSHRHYLVICYPIPWNWVRSFTHWLTLKLRVPHWFRTAIIAWQHKHCPHCGRLWDG
jgi:hypothetical protein